MRQPALGRTACIIVSALLGLLAILACSNPSSSGSSFSSSTNAVAAPSIVVSGSGIARTVSISCATSGASIYYTIDATIPSTSSALYTAPLTIAGYFVTKTITAVAVSSGAGSSIVSQTFSILPASALSLGAVVSTLAGSTTAGSANGTGSAASFNRPHGITTDGTNLYIAEYNNNDIRKLVIATGAVSTLAGSTTSGSADGTGSAASFCNLQGICTDGVNLYVGDYTNNEIRKIVIATGLVSTLAGSTTAGSADGTGSAASFNKPHDVATDGTNIYVADSGNNEIRKIVIATGAVSTLAGSTTAGSADGTGSAASFNNPSGIATDGKNLYIGDLNNSEIRKLVIATGVVTTLAGSTTAGHADGTGSAAGFYKPDGLATDGSNLYVADNGNDEIRIVSLATAAVSTLAGSTTAGSADGTGGKAGFYSPVGMAIDASRAYVTDNFNNDIREIQ